MNTREVLIQARKLIEKPEHWTRGSYAVTASGERDVNPWDPRVYKRCAGGAVAAVARSWVTGDDAYDQLRLAMGCSVIHFNDSHDHAEVLAAFDKAIASVTV